MKQKDYKLHQFLAQHGVVRKFKSRLADPEHNMDIRGGKDVSYEATLKKGQTNPDVIWGAFVFPDIGDEFDMWAELASKYKDMLKK